jgi:hypothetical protein
VVVEQLDELCEVRQRAGQPRWKQTEGTVTFLYRFASEDTPPINMRLKVEIKVPSGMWLEFGGAISSNMKVSFQAARSIG